MKSKIRVFKSEDGKYHIARNKRTIALKNQQLVRIRNNLRKVILEAIYKRLHEYNAHSSSKYGRLGQELRNTKNKSICRCPRCCTTDKNMTFNPIDETWYCVECYKEMHRWTAKKKTGISILFP